MSEFREPWRVGSAEWPEQRTIAPEDCIVTLAHVHNYNAQANAERIVACVNALAGRDPSKLAALEAAVERVLTFETCACGGGWITPPCHICQARAALKAFRGEE